jgi:chloramphenicol 3-O-phosphotransferase
MSDSSPARPVASGAPGGKVIVVTGPPGAGKTTIARLVTDKLSPSVHLHADDFWHFIQHGAIAPYLAEAHHQNTIVIGVLVRAAFGYATGGYDVICDGIIGPWFLDAFRTTSATNGVELHYLVLRPDEATTLRRAIRRTEVDALTGPEPIRSLYHQFGSLDALEQHALDTTYMTAVETAEVVLRAIADGRYRLS